MEEKYNKIVKWWQEKNIQTADDLKTVLDNFKYTYTYEVLKLFDASELTLDTVKDIYEGKRISGENLYPEFILAVFNYKQVFNYLWKMFARHYLLNVSQTIYLHDVLLNGRYLDDPNYAAYTPAEVKISKCISKILCETEELKAELNWDALTSASYLFAELFTQDVFYYGNKELATFAMNYYLMKNGHPPLVIFADYEGLLTEAMDQYSIDRSIAPVVEFLMTQIVRTWGSKVTKQPTRELETFL